MKICSLYGAGFYYIPGTDTCIKVGGWVRGYYGVAVNGSNTTGALVNNFNNNSSNNGATWRVRGYITADAREQTEYGTVRGYIAVGYSGDAVQGGSAPAFNANRGFIQWAGFTAGLAQSFFDFYSAPATSYFGGYINPSEDTGDAGQYVFGYTAQFGGGFSATIAAEDPVFNRRSGIFNAGGGFNSLGAAVPVNAFSATGGAGQTGVVTDSSGGIVWPDLVGNLRIDQSWGSAQIMAAAHQNHALYYSATDNTGSPGDKWGYALGAGIKLNAPMIGQGDYLQAEVNYAQGAVGYVIATNNRYAKYSSDTSYGTLAIVDGVYGGGGDIQLTTAWGVNAAYEHFWNPAWRTSVYGGYEHFSYNDQATAMLAASAVKSWGALAAGSPACGSGCFDSGVWNIGTRTQWNVTKNFYMGVDLVYQHLDTAANGLTFAAMPANGTRPGGAVTMGNQDAFMAQFRIHRDFYP